MFLFYQRIGRASGSRLPRKCRRTHDCTEYQLTGRERAEVLLLMERNLEVMKASVELGLRKINPVVA